MQDAAPSARVAKLLARLTAPTPDHESFRGPPVDITGLTPQELGKLWPAVQQALWSDKPAVRYVAFSIQLQARQLQIVPALDEPASVELFRRIPAGAVKLAVEALSYVPRPIPAVLTDDLRRILGDSTKWAEDRYHVAALSALADDDAQAKLRLLVQEKYPDSPYVLRELDVLGDLSVSALLALPSTQFATYYWPGHDEHPDPAVALADEPAYVEFAREALATARQRLEDVHSGAVAYVADGAFTVHDTPIIARAARVAAIRDEPWFGEVVGVLLPKSSVAPTDAKTTPSQSLAVALGHSVQGVPTPESIEALRAALSVVRHAGLEKKLSRNLKPAERALAERPDVALRLTASTKAGKAQQTILATCIEAGFWQEARFDAESWRKQLVQTAVGGPLARSLIWRAHGVSDAPVSFMLDGGTASMAVIDSRGKPARIDDATHISLWHPLLTEEQERDEWRSLIGARQIRQLIRQAYREYYVPDRSDLAAAYTEMFAGHMISIRPLIGLGGRQGWRIDKFDGLKRTFAEVRATFQVGADLYPGLEGWCDSGRLYFEKQEGRRWVSARIGDVRPVVFSEICRAVDLLVSVTTFAIEDGTSSMPLTAGDLGVTLVADGSAPQPKIASLHTRLARDARLQHLSDMNLNEMARMRREAVRRVFAHEIGVGSMFMDDRHVRVGDFAVHLGTARVTREGAPIDLQLPEGGPKLGAVPWLPYDEALLQKIADSVSILLRNPPN
jgi:hypothetical protein